MKIEEFREKYAALYEKHGAEFEKIKSEIKELEKKLVKLSEKTGIPFENDLAAYYPSKLVEDYKKAVESFGDGCDEGDLEADMEEIFSKMGAWPNYDEYTGELCAGWWHPSAYC